MSLSSRSLVVVALLALACGEKGGSETKISGMNDDAAPPAPGQEGGPPGTRGGGGGAFGGGSDPDAGTIADADLPGTDAPVSDARPDLGLTPVDAARMVDTAAPADLGTTACGSACDMYEADYKAALVRARTCLPASKGQCMMTAASGLACAGCKVWVNSTTELVAIRKLWMDAECQKCKVLCPQIACRNPTMGVCHSKMLAAPGPDPIAPPPVITGTCIDQSDPVPF